MLPPISKIFETVIYNQLYEYLQEHRVITNSQYRFRKKHSTEYTAIELVDRIIEKLRGYSTQTHFFIFKILFTIYTKICVPIVN